MNTTKMQMFSNILEIWSDRSSFVNDTLTLSGPGFEEPAQTGGRIPPPPPS